MTLSSVVLKRKNVVYAVLKVHRVGILTYPSTEITAPSVN